MSYELTTVRQRVDAMAAEAIGIVLAGAADDASPQKAKLVPGDLIVRRSARLNVSAGSEVR